MAVRSHPPSEEPASAVPGARRPDEIAEQRDEAGDQRDDAAEQRDQAANHRDRAADTRDVAGLHRDEVADRRDLAASARDQAADKRDLAVPRHRAGDLPGGGLGPRQRDRTERSRAAEDRLQALLDRRAGATERGAAGLDRTTALTDRGSGAAERGRAGDDRDIALADRGASAADRRHASLDGLTGAYVRSAGLLELEREILRVQRSQQPLTLAFVDVDHLKDVNDAGGHAAGDRLLVRVAETLRARLRTYDLVVRYGGDEFVCVLAGVDAAEAEGRFALVNADLVGFGSVSVGVASLEGVQSAAELIALADGALYSRRQAERAG